MDEGTETTTQPELPGTLELKGTRGVLKVRLVVPVSRGLRYQVMYKAATSEECATAAALGLCSVSIRKHVAWDHDVLGFGQRVIDWLLEEGVEYLDIIAAARVAWLLVTRGLDVHKRIDGTEGFSEAKDGSTST